MMGVGPEESHHCLARLSTTEGRPPTSGKAGLASSGRAGRAASSVKEDSTGFSPIWFNAHMPPFQFPGALSFPVSAPTLRVDTLYFVSAAHRMKLWVLFAAISVLSLKEMSVTLQGRHREFQAIYVAFELAV